MDNRHFNFSDALKSAQADDDVRDVFQKSIRQGFFSKEENPFYHFCVYFPACDPINKLVFIGHHKKSGLWLFNGGHVDKNESPAQTLKREITEEWGIDIDISNLSPSLLTITNIVSNPAKIPCVTHYDIWFFIPQNYHEFKPDKKRIAEEFYEAGWKTYDEARALTKDNNTLTGINEIEKKYENY